MARLTATQRGASCLRAPRWVAVKRRSTNVPSSSAHGISSEILVGQREEEGCAGVDLGIEPGGRGLLVDRVLDDLLRDDLRVGKDAWSRDEDDEFERLLHNRSGDRHDEIDDFFARLE